MNIYNEENFFYEADTVLIGELRSLLANHIYCQLHGKDYEIVHNAYWTLCEPFGTMVWSMVS